MKQSGSTKDSKYIFTGVFVVTGDILVTGVMESRKIRIKAQSPVSLTPVNNAGNKHKVANISANFRKNSKWPK
jgi:hypothetical protein